MHGKNLELFKIYLRNRKQYIQTDEESKTRLFITYMWSFTKLNIWTSSVLTVS